MNLIGLLKHIKKNLVNTKQEYILTDYTDITSEELTPEMLQKESGPSINVYTKTGKEDISINAFEEVRIIGQGSLWSPVRVGIEEHIIIPIEPLLYREFKFQTTKIVSY